MPSVKPILYLGWRFILHGPRRIGRVVFGRKNGLETFLGHFREDGLGDLTAEEMALVRRFSSCVACGWCETQITAWTPPTAEMHPSPSALALALAGNPSDLRHAAPWIRALAGLPLDQVKCPFHVPLAEGVRFLDRRIGRIAPPSPPVEIAPVEMPAPSAAATPLGE